MRNFILLTHAPWHYISSRELAKHLGVTSQTLANWRFRGLGPKTEQELKFKGRSAYYRVAEIIAWERTQRGEAISAWEVTAQWLSERNTFPKPLETEERTLRVVDQLERWDIYPPLHRPRHRLARPV